MPVFTCRKRVQYKLQVAIYVVNSCYGIFSDIVIRLFRDCSPTHLVHFQTISSNGAKSWLRGVVNSTHFVLQAILSRATVDYIGIQCNIQSCRNRKCNGGVTAKYASFRCRQLCGSSSRFMEILPFKCEYGLVATFPFRVCISFRRTRSRTFSHPHIFERESESSLVHCVNACRFLVQGTYQKGIELMQQWFEVNQESRQRAVVVYII